MATAMVRRPVVAGYYYPAEPQMLAEQVDAHTRSTRPASLACGVIVPHGSFQRAGKIIGSTFARVRIPRRCILLGPSHAGNMMPWSLMTRGAYRTPLGDVAIDEPCAEALRMRCAFLEVDVWAQQGEHAIEVQIPFLQRLGPSDLTVVPVMVGSEDAAECAHMGRALAQVIRLQEEPVLLLAPADLSHYQPRQQGKGQDAALIAAIATLDGPGLLSTTRERSITMCGAGAAACVLEAAAQLGAMDAELVAYGMSDESGGDPDSVVGYAGIVIR